MKESDSWSKVKSDFSQNLNELIKGTLDTDAIIKQLDLLLSKNNLDNNSKLELKNLISSAKLPPEFDKLLLNRVSEQKTRIFQPPSPNVSQDNPADDRSEGHSSDLLKSLMQCGDNKQTSSIKSGQTIRGTYCLDFKIGSGGMGQVWKAVDLIQDAGDAKDKYVAIKFINHEIRSHPYALKALVREFARYKKLIHPNIVKAYELNRDENEVFITMEYLEGRELKEFIKQHPQGIPLKQAQPIIKAMCDALEYAHKEGIIHLDFKPGNVFYNPDTDICKVIDFGIARLSSRQARDETLFDPGTLGAMTTAYASSEMLMESEPDPRDDIYGLTCVVYELLSGHHPFNKCLSLKAEREQMRPKPIPGLSKDEFQALLNGLSFHRDQRTNSANDFFSELFSPQQVANQKRTKWLIYGSIIAISLVVLPFASYKGYHNWQLNQVSISIEQKIASGLDDFSSLSVDDQQELLDKDTFPLALAEYITSNNGTTDSALSVIAQFNPAIQKILFADRKVRDYLITYFSNRIDLAINQDNFLQAEQLSQRILQQYPDSMRLVEQSHSIKPQQAIRVLTLQKNYNQCLANKTKKLTELLPCFQKTRALLAKIDNTNALLKSPDLTNRYHEEISSAIKNKNFLYADTLIAHWHSLDRDDINQRTQLAHQLAYAKKLDNLIKQINTSNNLQLTQILSLFPTLDSNLKKDVLTHSTVKQRLMAFYQQTLTDYLSDNNFNAASQTISDGISLFSKNSKEQNKLKRLAKKSDQKKNQYLHDQENLYKKQLSQQEPEIIAIQNIQLNVSVIAPDNPLTQLPGLSNSYAKKIDSAITKEQYDLAQRLLNHWKLLKPADANSSKFIQLSDKKIKLLQAFEDRNKAALQLQDAINSKQLNRINELIHGLKNQFSKQDQKKIVPPFKDQLISAYQQHINTAVQQDAFDSASSIYTQIQSVFPKDKQVLAIKNDIAKAKELRINKLLADSRVAINADIIEGGAIFSPLLVIQTIDTEYLNDHPVIFQDLKQKLIMITGSLEQPLPQLKSVINQWDNFVTSHAHQSEKITEQYRKTKNLIALRCLFNGRKLKTQDKKTEANELFMFGLSLEPINTVRNALERELLQ